MKVVIDISEELYAKVPTLVNKGSIWIGDVLEAVENGTPLPKGHGRLIDADEIQFENTEFDTYGDYCIAFDAIDYAPTIIEADGGGEK